jgi:hypothetical protein
MNVSFKTLLGIPMVGVILILGMMNSCVNSKEKGKSEMLSTKEASTLRKIVYTKGLITSHEVSNKGIAYTVLDVPSEFETIYKAKRLPSLRLLLDIVKGGRPQDALSAAAFATAMEENPMRAAACATKSKEDFDEDSVGLGSTPRSRLVLWLEKLINEKREGK